MTKATELAARRVADPEADARILEAAARLFRERGFAQATVREIAAAAGMLPGSLHYRYASKDEILVALLERGVSRAIEAIEREVALEPDKLLRMRTVLRVHLELLLGDEDALYVLLFDWRTLPPGAAKGVEQVRARYQEFLDVLMADAYRTGNGRTPVDLELVRNFGMGASCWAATWYRKDGRHTPRQIADAFWHYMAYGLVREEKRPPNVPQLFEELMKGQG